MSDELNDLRKQVGCAGAALSIFVALPAWLYLLRFLLKFANADGFIWFIYWTYVPFTFLASTMNIWGRSK